MSNHFFKLNNGVEMPVLGLGVFQSSKTDTAAAVKVALAEGYRLIDCASAYQNEAEVGQGIRESDVDPSQIFVTTKLRPADYGYDATLRAFDDSMSKLKLEVLDLYLLHWPIPRDFENTLASWKACERLLNEGRVRGIGVCNFKPNHLDLLVGRSEVVPSVNQIELHPYFVQQDHDVAHKRLGIITQAWSPIGGIQRYWADGKKKDPLTDPVILALASKYKRTPAQIILRWQIELGHSVIPKSVKANRIHENAQIFDFKLSNTEVIAISALDTGVRGGPDPEIQGTPPGK